MKSTASQAQIAERRRKNRPCGRFFRRICPAGAGLTAYRDFAQEIVPEPEKPEEPDMYAALRGFTNAVQ